MGPTTAMGTRCSGCSAAVRPGAPWCTQCYAPAGAAAAPPPPHAPQPLATDAPGAAPVGSSTGAWPCSACPQHNDLALAVCAGCGAPFLAAAREDRLTVVLPLVGDLLALGQVRRLALAVCVAVTVVVAVVLVSALLALLPA